MNNDPLTMRYYTIAEVAELLGVSKMSVYRYIERDGLHAIRPGGRTFRIPEASLRAWLADLDTQPPNGSA